MTALQRMKNRMNYRANQLVKVSGNSLDVDFQSIKKKIYHEAFKKIVTVFTVAICLTLPFISQAQEVSQAQVGEVIPSWSEGYLEIHHINTGRGDAAFFILPDGTTMLFDAGDHSMRDQIDRFELMLMDPKPDNSRQPGEWISRYIQRIVPDISNNRINYGMISHFHADHMGGLYPGVKESNMGPYKISGITEVGDLVSFDKIIDRGWPDYNWPVSLDTDYVTNYKEFISWQIENNDLKVEQFIPGKKDQITLLNNPDAYPNFEIRNVAANGKVWTGLGDNIRNHFPPLESLSEDDYPTENMSSIVYRLSYGRFDYYTGGDLIGLPGPGAPGWHDMETPVAKAVGPVDVHVLNHHGYHDSANEFFLKALRPRVHIIHAEVASHPGQRVLTRLLSTRLYPGPRDIFATNVMDETIAVYGNADRINTPYGHMVIRVAPGGDTYQVLILDDSEENFRVKAVFGPYESN